MDPISGTAQILSILQQTLPPLITALHSVTPDGKAEGIIADMRRSAQELAGCADAGVLAPDRYALINDKIELVIEGQRALAGRKRFWDKWAKEHRKLVSHVKRNAEDLKKLAESTSAEVALRKVWPPPGQPGADPEEHAVVAHTKFKDASEAAGVNSQLLALAVGEVFEGISEQWKRGNDGPCLVVSNCSQVTVNQYTSKVDEPKPKASSKNARRPKEHRVAKDRYAARIPKPSGNSKISAEMINNLAECYLGAAFAPPMPGAWVD